MLKRMELNFLKYIVKLNKILQIYGHFPRFYEKFCFCKKVFNRVWRTECLIRW